MYYFQTNYLKRDSFNFFNACWHNFLLVVRKAILYIGEALLSMHFILISKCKSVCECVCNVHVYISIVGNKREGVAVANLPVSRF